MSRRKTEKNDRATAPVGDAVEPRTSATEQLPTKAAGSRRQKTGPSVRPEVEAQPQISERNTLADAGGPDGDGLDADIQAQIQAQAYAIYLARGGMHGDAVSDWLEAERTIRRRIQPTRTDERAPM
jgi:UTP:GlnB (protein PII) uridylyltransferase